MLEFTHGFILAAGLALGGFLTLCKLFEIFEKVLRKDKLQRIVDGVMHISFRAGARKILALWVYINNAIFGHKLMSWRAFWVSFLLTNIWALIFILVFSARYSMFRVWMLNIIEIGTLRWSALVIYFSVLIIEFLSICLTRKIYRLALSKGKKVFGWALLADLIGSVSLYYFGLSVAKLIFLHRSTMSPVEALLVWLGPENLTTLLQVTENFDMSNFKPDGHGAFKTDIPLSTEIVYAFPEGVFFFTSLLTSIWLWGYIAAYSLAYVCVRIDRLHPVLWRWVRIDEQPLLVLSVLFGLIGAFFYLLVSILEYIVRV